MTLICKRGCNLIAFITLAFMISILQACGVYSFTGASIPPEAKTISIQQFINNAPLVQPMLSQRLTDALRDKFSSQTNLSQVSANGDLTFEGYISDYNTQPVAITGDETAALNRLTISVKVSYSNRFDEKQNFEASFSRFEEYESSRSLSEVEDQLMEQIIDALVQDIFNRSVVNW
jgi:outer membrane lipopolysaccharide assembly protein LptE/RlpB